MAKIVCVVLARGGSKGIPGKNLVDFCGKPLLAWTVEQALAARRISSVWVSSDSREILDLATSLGAGAITRPSAIAADGASSESGWLHALEVLEKNRVEVETLVAPQCTSPVREAADFDRAIELFERQGLDSLFSAAEVADFNLWKAGDDGLTSFTYDYRKRGRRQDRAPQYLENGSFYLLRPELLRRAHNRLGGRIGIYPMPLWKSFQIDEAEDIRFCETLMRAYLPGGLL
jgi:N-acylneuraminate cytidylyltransferase